MGNFRLWSFVRELSLEYFAWALSFEAWGISLWHIRLGTLFWDLSFINFRLGSFAWCIEVGMCRLVTWFRIFRLASFAWGFSPGNFRLRSLAAQRPIGKFRLGLFARELWLDHFRLDSFVWELLPGNDFSLGNFGLTIFVWIPLFGSSCLGTVSLDLPHWNLRLGTFAQQP